MKAAIHSFDPRAEYDTPERCFINELSNTAADPDVSIARARVAPGAPRDGIACTALPNAT